MQEDAGGTCKLTTKPTKAVVWSGLEEGGGVRSVGKRPKQFLQLSFWRLQQLGQAKRGR